MSTTLETITIDIEKVQPNNYNPNRPLQEDTKMLAKSIESIGFADEILVRPPDEDGMYTIIDGEQRWKAMKSSEEKTIDAIVLDIDEYEAMIRTINADRIQGNLGALETASVIRQLLDERVEDEVYKRLAYNNDTIDGLLALTDEEPADTEDDRSEQTKDKESTDNRVYFKVQVSQKEYDIIMDVLETVDGSSYRDKLLNICSTYDS